MTSRSQAVSKHLKVLEDAGLGEPQPRCTAPSTAYLEADVFDLMNCRVFAASNLAGRPRNDTADLTPYSPPWTTTKKPKIHHQKREQHREHERHA